MTKPKPKATVTVINSETEPKQQAPDTLLRQIELQWLDRARVQGLPGPKSLTYQKAETEYFVGAMAALDACGHAPPIRWVMAIMSNGSVVQP